MTKIAILGGGVGALTTAFELTQPALNGQYDVTVFQMGWRLGGKGASGRDRTGPSPTNRIEEHGLHIWMGFYDNAFAFIQEVYDELDRKAPPLQKWSDAFEPHDFIVAMEPFNGGWERWEFDFPRNDFTPGLGPEPTLWEMTVALLQWIEHHWAGAGLTLPGFVEEIVQRATSVGTATARSRELSFFATVAVRTPAMLTGVLDPVSSLIARAKAIANTILHDSAPSDVESKAIAWLVRAIMRVAWALLEPHVATDFHAFEQWVSINLAGAAMVGMLEDGVLAKGWDSIDHLELRQWLENHGANQLTLGSAPMRAIYDLVFAYVDGDTQRPECAQFAAGTAMRGMLRMLFTYKGAIFYKMQAGMGDTIFTPLYQVLRRRGVKFRFFHRIDDLKVDATTKLITAVEMTEQVQLADPDYQPLVDVKGLPCWPNAPLYDQIVDGADLQKQGINLESAWAPPWRGERKKTVTCGPGKDFDGVVLGISIGAFPTIAKEVIAASAPFRNMVENVKTVQTCAFQLWLTPDLPGLGWKSASSDPAPPVLGAFVEPLDTWADMSHLLDRETWPAACAPKSAAYFCGPFQQTGPLPPPTDTDFPAREITRLRRMVIPFLEEQMVHLWPNASTGNGFAWDMLVDSTGANGPARLDSQYLRVNIDPSERYVLSVPGSARYRLTADGAGIENLFLAGDWTVCGINAGCVEGAVTSGMLAARAISGSTARTVAWEADRRSVRVEARAVNPWFTTE